MSLRLVRMGRCLSRLCRPAQEVTGRILMGSNREVARTIHSRNVGVVGVPFRKGQSRQGVDLGPEALRESGLIVEALQDLGHEVKDYGNLSFEKFEDLKLENVNNPKAVGAANEVISQAVREIINKGEVCLALGGDHSLSIGSIHGHAQQQSDIVIIWVDAHADINTPLASVTGNIHGMPLSFLVRETQEYMNVLPGFEWMKPCISAKDIAYIGLRDLDPAEKWLITKLGISCYCMHEVDKHGISNVFKMAMADVDPEGKRPIHFSFDIDSLDPYIAGSTGTPAIGGLTLREGLYIAEEVAKTERMSAMDIVEVNPLLGSETERNSTVRNAVEIAKASFGKERVGSLPPRFSFPGVPSVHS